VLGQPCSWKEMRLYQKVVVPRFERADSSLRAALPRDLPKFAESH
jgi:hypothetical protein